MNDLIAESIFSGHTATKFSNSIRCYIFASSTTFVIK